jgi:hypothetical protein
MGDCPDIAVLLETSILFLTTPPHLGSRLNSGNEERKLVSRPSAIQTGLQLIGLAEPLCFVAGGLLNMRIAEVKQRLINEAAGVIGDDHFAVTVLDFLVVGDGVVAERETDENDQRAE